MALSTITLDGQPVTLVDLPVRPGKRTVQWNVSTPAAAVPSGYSGKAQIQKWPGADSISGTISMPPMQQADADEWIAFLLLLEGQSNGFQLSDPMKPHPRGNPQKSVPVVDGSVVANNVPGSLSLHTKGWIGSGHLLEVGDWIQIGYRLYRNLLPVMAAGDGSAILTVKPSLREQPPDGTKIILNTSPAKGLNPAIGPRGVFRLIEDTVTWSVDSTRLTALSFKFTELRGATYVPAS